MKASLAEVFGERDEFGNFCQIIKKNRLNTKKPAMVTNFQNFREFWDYDESRKFRQNVKLMQIG